MEQLRWTLIATLKAHAELIYTEFSSDGEDNYHQRDYTAACGIALTAGC